MLVPNIQKAIHGSIKKCC